VKKGASLADIDDLVGETKQEVKGDAKEKGQKAKLLIGDDDRRHLDAMGFDFAWLDGLSLQYGFDQFQYMHKFRAFRCYRDGKHLEWIDVNELALLNGKRELTQILLRHQQVDKSRRIIDLPWRKMNERK
jgi:hypothetical protein